MSGPPTEVKVGSEGWGHILICHLESLLVSEMVQKVKKINKLGNL